jgi:ABC-type Fe3+ transport system permease subunit
MEAKSEVTIKFSGSLPTATPGIVFGVGLLGAEQA